MKGEVSERAMLVIGFIVLAVQTTLLTGAYIVAAEMLMGPGRVPTGVSVLFGVATRVALLMREDIDED